MKKAFSELNTLIKEAKNIVIISHVNPDGDTLGSNLALKIVIKEYFNKDSDSIYVGCLPSVYKYLPLYSEFIDAKEKENKKYDLAICTDVASKDRMVYANEIFERAEKKVNIDHHKTNIGYGDINIIDGDAACCGLILYRMFKQWGIKISLDCARCLYTSLMTDTGNFKYENTTPEVFNTAAELIRAGVNASHEYRACYESKPQNLIQFQSYIISNTKFYDNGKIAMAAITKKDMEKFNATDDFTEGIVEILRTSKDVEISALLKETNEGNTKVSLRSKNTDLTKIVSAFNGGGHSFAAGCTIKRPVNIASSKLLERIQSELL